MLKMGRVLKQQILPNGKIELEKGCGNYVCRSCGGKATACNYVAGLILQVYAKHYGLCGSYVETDKYKGYITDCSTCQYQNDGVCEYEGKETLTF